MSVLLEGMRVRSPLRARAGSIYEQHAVVPSQQGWVTLQTCHQAM